MLTSVLGILIYPCINIISVLTIAKKIIQIKHFTSFVIVYCGIELFFPILAAIAGSFLTSYSYLLYYSALIFPLLLLFFFFQKKEGLESYLAVFLTLFLYLIVHTSNTFLSVILSSLTGDDFAYQYLSYFFILIAVISFFYTTRIVKYFDFQIKYFKDPFFKRQIQLISFLYLMNFVSLNFSHWLSTIKQYNSFSSMLATICFLVFQSSLIMFKNSREKFDKEEQLHQKELEQLRLQEYTEEIVNLYHEIKGFRHDYSSMLTSMRMAIESGDMKEVERIYQEVLIDANINMRSDKYTIFDVNNVGDSALKSVLTEVFLKAREHKLEVIFEVKDRIEELPISLLDVVRIASILFNNALEGAIDSYEKLVHISLVQLEKETIFIVKNSRKDQYLDLEEIYQPEFSTKGEGRGFGLNNIKEILDKYEYITLDTEIERFSFTQILTIRREQRV